MITLDIGSLRKYWAPTTGVFGGGLRFVLAVDEWTVEIPDQEWITEAGDGTSFKLGDKARATQWFLTPQGWSAVLVGPDELDDSLEWLEEFAGVFGDAINGELRGGPPSARGTQRARHLAPTSVLYLSTVDLAAIEPTYLAAQWAVEPEVTRRAAQEALDWVHQIRGRTYLNRDGSWWTEIVGHDNATPLAEAIEWALDVRIQTRRSSPTRIRTVAFRRQGELGAQVQDDTLSPLEQFELAAKVLRWCPELSNYGYVFWNDGEYIADPGESWPHWPDLDESYVRYNRPLLDRFVPDAQPIQLLTSAHLDRANDLTAWHIESLGNDRHLVTARDLDPWLVPPSTNPDHPGRHIYDPALKAAARRDFGDMILTLETIAANPWR